MGCTKPSGAGNRAEKGTIPALEIGGSGSPLFFLHANGYPPACYRPLLESLAERFKVTAMEQRPLWQAAVPKDFDSWIPLTDDLLSFLDDAAVGPVLAVGHSLGAVVLLRAALWRPAQFRGIVLIEPVLFLPIIIMGWRLIRNTGLGHRLHPQIRPAQKRRREFSSLDQMFHTYRRRAVFRFLDDEQLEALVSGLTMPCDGGYCLRYSPEWEARIYHTGVWPDTDLWRGLRNLTLPCLVIRGEDSETYLEGAARRLRSIAPATQLHVIPHASHLVPLERPAEVSSIVQAFTSELSA